MGYNSIILLLAINDGWVTSLNEFMWLIKYSTHKDQIWVLILEPWHEQPQPGVCAWQVARLIPKSDWLDALRDMWPQV